MDSQGIDWHWLLLALLAAAPLLRTYENRRRNPGSIKPEALRTDSSARAALSESEADQIVVALFQVAAKPLPPDPEPSAFSVSKRRLTDASAFRRETVFLKLFTLRRIYLTRAPPAISQSLETAFERLLPTACLDIESPRREDYAPAFEARDVLYAGALNDAPSGSEAKAVGRAFAGLCQGLDAQDPRISDFIAVDGSLTFVTTMQEFGSMFDWLSAPSANASNRASGS